MTVPTPELGAVSVRTPLLARFHAAGVLGVADVHTAEALGRIVGEHDERVLLAAALTVRALRNGSVCLDLRTADELALPDDDTLTGPADAPDLGGLPWPDQEPWLAACRASVLVAGPDAPPSARPLRLSGTLLYLERYWQQEESVRLQLAARFGAGPPALDAEALERDLARLFPPDPDLAGEPDRQRAAAEAGARRWVTVLAGGPGTGKTTTVARLLALLRAQPDGPALRVALAAPTGKAAARLAEAVRDAARRLPATDRERLGTLDASTVHRLLGWKAGSRSRFRHDATNPLPHDVVVVDEMSMVSLTLMARLLDAVRPDARLVLVGDPDQLSSVEAGAVLADITGPAQRSVVRLTHNWRFEGGIARLAQAVRTGDADAALAVLREEGSAATLAPLDPAAGLGTRAAGIDELSDRLARSAAEARRAALAGEPEAALAAVETHRLLCAHRRGPYGVTRWNVEVEQWLARTVPGYAADGEFYLGRPLLVTANDRDLDLWNGDTGVVTLTPQGLRAAFARAERPLLYPPVRLDAVSTVHAMTVHKAQGSQFEAVTLVLPPPESPLLTRELLYTALTRAEKRVLLLGSEEAVRAAIDRPASRASGLRDRMG